MKHLPKHLQPRWRYLAVHVEARPGATLDREQFQRALWYGAQNLVGDAGSADLDLSVLRFRFTDGAGEAVVRTRRGSVRTARAAIASVSAVDGQEVGILIRGVSGTIRACEEKYMGHQREAPEERTVVFDGAERSGIVRGERVDVSVDGSSVGATTMDLH